MFTLSVRVSGQVDLALRRDVGMAMGFFEMSDLAGNDVGWRLRQGFNLVGKEAPCLVAVL